MNTQVPILIQAFFIVTTFITLRLLVRSSSDKKIVILISVIWLLAQGIISLTGFYVDTSILPPRFIFLAPPALLLILVVFITKRGRIFIDNLNQEHLTWIHVVRVPVELVLYWLFIYRQVPEIMTFEGYNFDILSGLSAPFIAVFGFRKMEISKKIILLWNVICLLLLFNIVTTAVLSAPTPVQQFAFDTPNVGVLYFPFTWLPCFIVPVVLFAHLAQIRKLLQEQIQSKFIER